MEIFLDSSVIILGLEKEKSNSTKILDLVFEKKIEATINSKVLIEVRRYFSKRRNNNYAFLIENLLRKHCKIIYESDLEKQILNFKGKMKEKDLIHLATVKELSLKYLIAFDRDFKPFNEYKTPKQFLKELKIKSESTDY